MRALMKLLQAFRRSRDGAVAIEFAFVFPVLLIISIGALDIALLMFEFHNSSEATRRGVREAVIQIPLVSAGDISTAGATGVTCQSNSGTVSCSSGTVLDDTIFTDIYDMMSPIVPDLTADDVTVTYLDSGVTTGGIVTPAVTVRVRNVSHEFFVAFLLPGFSGNMTLPSFRSTRLMASSN